jgi:putative methyltransferase (TIGR04325 family)
MPLTPKWILRSVLPPLLWNIGKDLKRRLFRSVDHMEYAPQGWATPLPSGADSQEYWNTFISRERAACRRLIARVEAGEPFLMVDQDENLKHIVFGYVLALVARQKQQITVLDYGGNLGDYYWLGMALLPGVALEYHCKELPEVAEAGRQITPAVTWHTDDACLDQPHDLVMFSSSLQYLPEWRDVLCRGARGVGRYLFLADVPTVRDAPGFVATHRTRGMTNLHHQFNRQEIVDTVERAGLRLVREFDMGAHPPVANAPEQPRCVGWLFQRDPAGLT